MSYIIDGHNLIGVLPDIHLHQLDDEKRLLDRLASYRARTGGRGMIVFFDSGPYAVGLPEGTARPRLTNTPGIDVRFTKPGQSADDAILAFLHKAREPGQYAVVTNDRGLADRARVAGASVLRASEFAVQLERKVTQPRKAPTPDVATAPNPHDPAFADLNAAFLAAEKAQGRLSARKVAMDFGGWVERLYSGDRQLAERAAQWLGDHGGAPAQEPLRDALTHADAAVRAAAALGLGNVGRRASFPALTDRLLNDGNSMVREAAAQALRNIGDRSVIPSLEAALHDSKSKVRKAAAEALAAIKARNP